MIYQSRVIIKYIQNTNHNPPSENPFRSVQKLQVTVSAVIVSIHVFNKFTMNKIKQSLGVNVFWIH